MGFIYSPANMLFLFSSLPQPSLPWTQHPPLVPITFVIKTTLLHNTQHACFPELGLHGRWDILKLFFFFLVHIAGTCPNFALYQPDPVSPY